jgi:hypothetical protein
MKVAKPLPPTPYEIKLTAYMQSTLGAAGVVRLSKP